jgi:transaldolase
MTRLHQLHDRYGQSPWLDNLTRGDLNGDRLRRLVAQGIRGVTSNPTIIAKAISGSADYDGQLAALAAAGRDAEASYWALVTSDLNGALAVLRPLYEHSGGADGFVSVELAPALAHEKQASLAAARALHRRIPEPNLLVKIPATVEGVAAVRQATAEGLSINVTLLFGLDRPAPRHPPSRRTGRGRPGHRGVHPGLQAFSHVGLISASINLQRGRRTHQPQRLSTAA